MPCRDYLADEENENNRKNTQSRLDSYARMLCAVCTDAEKAGLKILESNSELRLWWEQHKIADAKEQAKIAEAERKKTVRQTALDKLSDEEREELGI